MLKLTIREMLFVAAIVALACGWWVDHQRQQSASTKLAVAQATTAERLSRLLGVLEKRGESVEFSDTFVTFKTSNRATLYPSLSREGWKAITTSSGQPPTVSTYVLSDDIDESDESDEMKLRDIR